MTLEEQIMKLQTYKMFEGEDTVYVERDDVLKLLEQEPCETQMIDKSNFSQEQYKADLQSAYDCGKASVKPCEDTISRQAVLMELDKYLCGVPFDEKGIDEVIKELPPVTPQPKTGHWIDRFPAKECKCSVCDFLICISNGSYIDMAGQMKYCPNCGAKMAESEE